MKRLLSTLLAAVLMFFNGCKVSSPGNLENSLAKSVKRNLTIGGKDLTNPMAYTPEAAKEGGEHFQHHCQICHGLDGQNTGVPFALQMSPPVADLQSADVQKYSDGQLKWIIQNGIEPSGMPAWHGILDEDEMWKIVLYIRHLPPKGSLGIPLVFKEEAEAHAELEKQAGKKPAVREALPHTHHHHHPQ